MVLLQPGIRILSQDNDGNNIGSGTLGLILTDNKGRLFMLTALHVIGGGIRGSNIIVGDSRVAKFNVASPYFLPAMDAVAIEIIKEKNIEVSNRITGSGKIIRDWGLEYSNRSLFAMGATSHSVECILDEYVATYAGTINHVAMLRSSMGRQYCAPGDSGAVWCAKDGYAVSMHIQGGLPNNEAVSVRIREILKGLQLSIYKYPSALHS